MLRDAAARAARAERISGNSSGTIWERRATVNLNEADFSR